MAETGSGGPERGLSALSMVEAVGGDYDGEQLHCVGGVDDGDGDYVDGVDGDGDGLHRHTKKLPRHHHQREEKTNEKLWLELRPEGGEQQQVERQKQWTKQKQSPTRTPTEQRSQARMRIQ